MSCAASQAPGIPNIILVYGILGVWACTRGQGTRRADLEPWFRKGLTGIETEMKMRQEDYKPDEDIDLSEEPTGTWRQSLTRTS